MSMVTQSRADRAQYKLRRSGSSEPVVWLVRRSGYGPIRPKDQIFDVISCVHGCSHSHLLAEAVGYPSKLNFGLYWMNSRHLHTFRS
jgi:hypothetical protein